tara:strand:+ start:105 stop:434 length:330 start_codon:yes stop_codon:yes gene_type:complete
MGYSNYWKQEKSFDDSEWKQIKDEYELMKLELGEIQDQTESDDEIAFNGIGEEQCETFILSKNVRTVADFEGQDLSFNFCKTRELPYDLAVWHLLTFIKQFGIKISRDR